MTSQFAQAIIRSPHFNDITKKQRYYLREISTVPQCYFRLPFIISRERAFDEVCSFMHPIQLVTLGFDHLQVPVIIEEMQKEIAAMQYCADHGLSETILSVEFYNQYIELYLLARDHPEDYAHKDHSYINIPSVTSVVAPRKPRQYKMHFGESKPAKKYKKRQVIPVEHNRFNRNWQLLDKVCADETIRSFIPSQGGVYREVNAGSYEFQTEEDDVTFPVRDLLANAIATERVVAKMRRDARKEVVAKVGTAIQRPIPNHLKAYFPEGQQQASLTALDEARKQRSKERAKSRLAQKGINGYLQNEAIIVNCYYTMDFTMKKIPLSRDEKTGELHLSHSNFLRLRKDSPLLQALSCRYPVGFKKANGSLVIEGEEYLGSVLKLHRQFQELDDERREKLRREREEVNAVVSPVQSFLHEKLVENNPDYGAQYEDRLVHNYRKPITLKRDIRRDEQSKWGVPPTLSEIYPQKMQKNLSSGRWSPETNLNEEYVAKAQFNENSKEAQQFLLFNKKRELKKINLTRCVELLKISETPFFEKSAPVYVQQDCGKPNLPQLELEKDFFRREYVAYYEIQGPERLIIEQLTNKMGMNAVTLVSGTEVAKMWFCKKSYLTVTTDEPITDRRWTVVGYASVACSGHLRTQDGTFTFPNLIRVEKQRFTLVDPDIRDDSDIRLRMIKDYVDCEGDYIGVYAAKEMRKEETTHEKIIDAYLRDLAHDSAKVAEEKRIDQMTAVTDRAYFRYHEMNFGFHEPFPVYYDKQQWLDLQGNIFDKIQSISERTLEELREVKVEEPDLKANNEHKFLRRNPFKKIPVYFPEMDDDNYRAGVLSYFIRIGTSSEYSDNICKDKANPRHNAYYTLSDQCCRPGFLVLERGDWFMILDRGAYTHWHNCPSLRFSFDFNECASASDLHYAEKFFGAEARDCIERPFNKHYKKYPFSFREGAFEERQVYIPPKTVHPTAPPAGADIVQRLLWKSYTQYHSYYMSLDEFTELMDSGRFEEFASKIPKVVYGSSPETLDPLYLHCLLSHYHVRKGNEKAMLELGRQQNEERLAKAKEIFTNRGGYRRKCDATKTDVARAIRYIYQRTPEYFGDGHAREINWALDWTKHLPADEAIEIETNTMCGFSGLGECDPRNAETNTPRASFSSSSSEEDESDSDDPPVKRRPRTIFG